MRDQVVQILKEACANHWTQLIKNRNTCLGILKDYGGREYPEITVVAEAVDFAVPQKLEERVPLTQSAIFEIAEAFAAASSSAPREALFATYCWAEALDLYQTDPLSDDGSTLEFLDEGSTPEVVSGVERPNWFYIEVGARKGPVSEFQMREMIQAGAVHKQTSVWRLGMNRWEPAGQNFSDAFFPFLVSFPKKFKTTCPNCTQSVEMNIEDVGERIACPVCAHDFTFGEKIVVSPSMDLESESMPDQSKSYGGLRRVPFCIFLSGLIFSVVIGFFVETSETGLAWLQQVSLTIAVALVFFRLRNLGEDPLHGLLLWVPWQTTSLLNRCCFDQEGRADASSRDADGRRMSSMFSRLISYLLSVSSFTFVAYFCHELVLWLLTVWGAYLCHRKRVLQKLLRYLRVS
jgi:hypothetical protein